MKKFLLISILTTLAAGSVFGQSVIQITSEEDMYQYGGFTPLCISPNGRYIGGCTFHGNAFIYDVQESKPVVFTEDMGSFFSESAQVLALTNEGVGFGFDDNGGCMFSADGGYKVVDGANDYPIITLDKCNDDGSVVVGYVADKTFYSIPCYWENETRVVLPRPTDEELGFVTFGCQAIGITGDGSIILGRFVDRSYTFPMVIWQLQSDGSYKYMPVSDGKFEPLNILQMDPADGSLSIYERGDNPYLRYQGCAISADGKYVAMIIQQNTDAVNPPLQLGIYTVATGELEVIPNNGALAEGGEFAINGISNSRDVVGNVGEPLEGMFPFVFTYQDKESKSFNVEFNDLPLMATYQGWYEIGNNWLSTGITPDSQYIIGYIIHPIEWAGIAYLINTGYENTGVQGVPIDPLKDGVVKYYSIDGREHSVPVKGINIVKYPDGTIKKTIFQ